MNRTRVFLLAIALIVSIVAVLSLQNPFLTHFVDEDDNFVLGNYVSQGEKLYSDLFSHHQPLAYIASASIQKIAQPSNMWQLVKVHRVALAIWSLAWLWWLTKKFGRMIVLFALVFEFVKAHLFGQLFLSESLAVYPLVCITLSTLKISQKPKQDRPVQDGPEKNCSIVNFFFLGFSTSLVLFLLAPLWPVVGFLSFILLAKLRKQFRKLFVLVLGTLPIVAIVFYFAPLRDYLFNAIAINTQYYIPLSTNNNDSIQIINAFLTPLIALFNGKTGEFAWVIRLWSLLFIVGELLLIKSKKYRTAILSFIILGLANLRYVEPGFTLFEGFHLLPWFALLLALTSHIYFHYFKDCLSGHEKTVFSRLNLLYAALGLAVFVSLYSTRTIFFSGITAVESYTIHYQPIQDLADEISANKKQGDTLATIPEKWLLYWAADIDHGSKMINYHDWMMHTPPLRAEIDRTFANNPPTFLYCNCENSYVVKYLEDYEELRKKKNQTNLFVLKKN